MLARQYRLVKDQEYSYVFRRGQIKEETFLSLRVAPNNIASSRFGFVVSRKIAKKATARNLIKRRLIEAVRRKLDEIKPGYDLVILAKSGIEEKKFNEISQTLEILLNKAGLL